jgi:hypothetical protein
MAPRHLRALPLALVLAAALPFSCKRELACPDFDSCSSAKTCPWLRCLCDDTPETFPATCRADGTCNTTRDCAELCESAGTSCAHPPESCDTFIPTACECTNGESGDHFAAAWNCKDGSQLDIFAYDCDLACDQPTMGEGGAGISTSSTFSSSTF